MIPITYTHEQQLIFNEIIEQYSLDTGLFIGSYRSITEAARCTRLTVNLITKWIQGKSTLVKPTYIFKRKESLI